MSACQYFHREIKEKGMDYVVKTHANLDRIGKYGAGGGRLDGAGE